MKKVSQQFIYSLLLLSQFSLFAEAKRVEIIELDHIVAVVNKDVITAEELKHKQKSVVSRLRAKQTRLPPESILRKQILDQMIVTRIQLQLAYDRGIRISDEQLNRIIEQIAADNKMDSSSFREELVSQGYNFATFREEIRNDVIIKQLRKRQISNKIFVTEQEVNAELANLESKQGRDQEYHLGHILIAVPESSRPEEVAAARQKAEEVIGQLKLGRDFSEMAIRVSAGQTALQGGDLGWMKQGQIPTIATNTVMALEIGAISDPIRNASGFHIIKLIDKRSAQSKHIVEQSLARHILIKPNQVVSNKEAEKKLIQIRQRILSGDDFATLAKATSDDPGSARLGGDLGWINPGQMVTEFEEVLKRLKPGEISQPFRSRFGWHIIELLSRRKHDDTDAYFKAQARTQIHKRKSSEQTSI
ncbi:MAG TPA: molecular chaperone SurA, partial [Gammaproteobacteria bacterium]|nr:molecular chaperone SurA [Gammaproteobacteria bacterium]